MVKIQESAEGVIVPVRAQAGARRNAILGERDGYLRMAVTAAPEKGKANRAIIELLSDALDVSKAAIELVSGASSREKRFLICGGRLQAVREAIAKVLDKG